MVNILESQPFIVKCRWQLICIAGNLIHQTKVMITCNVIRFIPEVTYVSLSKEIEIKGLTLYSPLPKVFWWLIHLLLSDIFWTNLIYHGPCQFTRQARARVGSQDKQVITHYGLPTILIVAPTTRRFTKISSPLTSPGPRYFAPPASL